MSAAPARWRLKIPGTRPRLTIEERDDRPGLYLLWWEQKDKRRRPRLEGLDTVREEDGSVDPDLEAKAQRLGLHQYRGIRTSGGRGGSVATGADARPAGPAEPLSLRTGFDRFLAVPGGRYPKKTQQWRASRKARDRVLEILGEARSWKGLKRGDIRTVWRTFARRHEESKLGWRMAEQTVSALLACGRWLLDEDHIDSFVTPPTRWKGSLKEDWREITGLSHLPRPERPRHKPEELSAIWMRLPDADTRLRLALQLAMEYRGGQAVRGERKDLDLTPGAGAGHGTFRIHGRGRKTGETIYLTPEQREAVDEALSPAGYLGTLETQFRTGDISNFPLWPGGKLVKGQAKLNGTLMSRRTLLEGFYLLEKAAGVKHEPGRGLYGLRRLAADLTSRETDNERVRDAAGGWASGSSTRERIYMEELGNDPFVLVETAETRARTRASLGSKEEATTAAVGPPQDASDDAQRALKRLGYSDAQLVFMLSIPPDQAWKASGPDVATEEPSCSLASVARGSISAPVPKRGSRRRRRLARVEAEG